MAHQASGTPDYTMGFSEEFMESLRRYTAQASAAYLLPNLRPGLRILDFGCGPGTISVGLAKAVAPGELHGVDMEQSQIDLAKSVALANGIDNAIFHVGDVTDLPFEDDFFDVAHCHNVLMHIPDTQSVLAEVKTSPQARRHHRLPGNDFCVQLHGARLRRHQKSMGHVRGPCIRR